MTTFGFRPRSWFLAAPVLAAAASAARADVEVTLSRAQGAAVAVARKSSDAGDGAISIRALPTRDDVASYDETVRTEAEFEGIRSTGHATHRTTVEVVGDTLTFTSSALGSGTTTLTGDSTTDLVSGGSGGVTYDLGFRVSQRSTYTLAAVLDTTFAIPGPFDGFSSSGGAQVTLQGFPHWVGLPRGSADIQPSHLNFSETGVIQANTLTVLSLWMTGASASGTGRPAGRSQWHVTLTVAPAPLFTDEFSWIDVLGGDFSDAANWNPQAVPVETDTEHATAIFPLFTDYSIDVGTQRTDRLIVRNGVVEFVDAVYTVDSPSLADPAFVVTDFGVLRLQTGFLFTENTSLGPEAGSSGEVVVGAGGTWVNSRRLAVGAGGDGSLTLASGADVTSAESLVGAGGDGEVVVEAGAKWTTGNVLVGSSTDGSLSIEGGTVESLEACVGFAGSSGEVVLQRGAAGAGHPSWSSGSLTVGRQGAGFVEIRDGGDVSTRRLDLATTPGVLGSVTVRGSTASENGRAKSLLVVDGDAAPTTLSVGNGGAGYLNVVDGGAVIVGLFTPSGASIGTDGGTGFVDVGGADPLDPEDPSSSLSVGGALLVGQADGSGTVTIASSGSVDCKSASVGGGISGEGLVELEGDAAATDATKWSVEGDLAVGARGAVAIFDSLVEVGGDVSIFGLGTVVGVNGRLRVTETVYVYPGGFLLAPLRAGNQVVDVAKRRVRPVPSPAVFTIDGDLEMTGTVVVEVSGLAPETRAARLVVTGDAILGGTLVLQFTNGYAPKRGDPFDVLQVAGTTTGSFAAVEARGLAPGAQFETSFAEGALTVTALNDASALPTVSVKATRKKLSEKKRRAGTFTISRKGGTANPLTVRLAIGGRAENGIDYLLVPAEVTIPSRKKSVRVKLVPLQDGAAEPAETVDLRVLPGADYTHSLRARASLTIVDRGDAPR